MDWKETYKNRSGDIDQVFKKIKDEEMISSIEKQIQKICHYDIFHQNKTEYTV